MEKRILKNCSRHIIRRCTAHGQVHSLHRILDRVAMFYEAQGEEVRILVLKHQREAGEGE